MKILYFLSKKVYFKQGFRGRVIHALGVIEGHESISYKMNVLHLGGVKDFVDVKEVRKQNKLFAWLWLMINVSKYDRILIRYAISDLVYLLIMSTIFNRHKSKICLEVNTVHGMNKRFAEPTLKNSLIIGLEKVVLRRFLNLYVVSNSSKEFLINKYELKGNIIVVPNAVLKLEVKESVEYLSMHERLVYFGSLHSYYDLETTLKWLKKLNKGSKKKRLLYIYGNNDNNIVQTWTRNKLPVKYMGKYINTDLDQLLKSNDILLLPYKEGTVADFGSPMKLFEYAIKGLPVLATNFPQFSSVLRDGCVLYSDEKTFVSGLKEISSNYDDFKMNALNNISKNIKENSWEQRIRILHQEWK